MNTLRDAQYIGGIPWCMWGGYHDSCGRISWVHRGCSEKRGMFRTSGRYHEYIRGRLIHQGFQYKWKAFISLLLHMNHDIPTMYLCYPPHESFNPSDVLNIPWCTQDIPPMYSWCPPMYWTSPNVLKISLRCTYGIPRCTEHPPCTEHTLYGVINFKLVRLHIARLLAFIMVSSGIIIRST